jgi:hypothetical protein
MTLDVTSEHSDLYHSVKIWKQRRVISAYSDAACVLITSQ